MQRLFLLMANVDGTKENPIREKNALAGGTNIFLSLAICLKGIDVFNEANLLWMFELAEIGP